jgi:hypothetical protein
MRVVTATAGRSGQSAHAYGPVSIVPAGSGWAAEGSGGRPTHTTPEPDAAAGSPAADGAAGAGAAGAGAAGTGDEYL